MMNETTIPANYECEDISTFNEINLLRCKLETKSQVLKSISKELIICKKEKDEFKLMAEQLGEKCSLMKRKIERLNSLKDQNDELDFGSLDGYNQLVLNQNYKKLQDSNKLLNLELNDLRIKLTDADSDVRLLRDKLSKMKKRDSNYSNNIIDHISDGSIRTGQLKNENFNEHLIQQIERLKMRNKELEKDLKLNLDEKEDLIKSRNNCIQKMERLNENLNSLMNDDQKDNNLKSNRSNDNLSSNEDHSIKSQINQSKRNLSTGSDHFLDIDSILSENSFLKEKLNCLEQDKKMNQEMIAKYKQTLDKTISNKKNFFELPNLTSKKPNDCLNYLNKDIVSTKEIQTFISSNDLDNLEVNEASILKLRKLVLILFESVSDKSAALSLAKKNNKLLGKRLDYLESKLKKYESREKDLRVQNFKMKLNEMNDDESNGGLDKDQFDEKFFYRDEMNSVDNSKDDLLEDQNDKQNDKEMIKSNNLREDENGNIIDVKEIETTSDHTIDLPISLQRLVEKELEKLKNDL